jgi:hypothetical protein
MYREGNKCLAVETVELRVLSTASLTHEHHNYNTEVDLTRTPGKNSDRN